MSKFLADHQLAKEIALEAYDLARLRGYTQEQATKEALRIYRLETKNAEKS